MNYYIQGDAAKADKIKAAFEAKGYDISWPGGCANPDVINIGVERNGAKYVVAETSEYIKDIIKTHPDYKELELPVKPNFKVGDWVVKKDGTTFYGGNYAEQITLIESDGCLRRIWLSSTTWLRDNDIRLWTIADAKDGDVLATDNGWACIFKAFDGCVFSSYCFMDSQKWFCEFGSEAHTLDSRINGNIHPATEEQRDQLFSKMKEAGYTWDEKKKELRKIQPHYDIANFHTGMPVLVRDCDEHKWLYTIFGIYNKDNSLYPFVVVNMCGYRQCIPFEGNKHLLGTTDMCPEEYINW